MFTILMLLASASIQAAEFNGSAVVTTEILAEYDQSESLRDVTGQDLRVRIGGEAAKAVYDKLTVTLKSRIRALLVRRQQNSLLILERFGSAC